MPTQESRLLEGKILAQEIQQEIRNFISALPAGQGPALAAIHTSEDPASAWYIGQQEKLAAKLGIRFEKIPAAEVSTQQALVQKIKKLSSDAAFHGIFVAMPLPKGFDSDEALLALDARKDVEGIHPTSLGLIVLRKAKLNPPTAFAALRLIEWAVKESKKDLKGMKAAMVGQSAIVGRPLQLLLGERRVTTFVCNTGTSAADMEKICQQADIVVGCAGNPGLIKGSWIKPGAIVIDVGTTEVEGKLKGDVEFEEAKNKAAFITPVPGGVGPLTVTMLMGNLVRAFQWQRGDNSKVKS